MEIETHTSSEELEIKSLNAAAEKLKNIKFSSENYKEILDVINKINDITQLKLDNEEQAKTEKKENDYSDFLEQNFSYGETILPPFLSLMENNQLKQCENFVLMGYDRNTDSYLIDNGEEKLNLPRETMESLLNPNIYEQQKKEEHEQTRQNLKGAAFLFENSEQNVKGTTIPEFSLMIRGELKTYEGYVAIKRDNDGIYTLKKGNGYLTVDKDKFQEITAPERFRQKFDEKTPGWQKIIKSQYEDFFAQRENTSYNFRHNLAVYCRREANSPCDAIKIAKKIIEKMPLPEQKKIKKMLNSMKHEGETINQLIARNYHEAIKEIPLHENYIKKFRPENRIARPFYDTITENGQKLENDPKLIRGDRDFNLKIGDSIKNIDISTEKLFGKGTEKIKFAELIVISASREGNTITLMDRNKSFIEVPRDTLLQAYKQQQMQEIKHSQDRKRNSVEISYN